MIYGKLNKLAELHGIRLSVESVCQLMARAGYWKFRRGGTVCAHPMCEPPLEASK